MTKLTTKIELKLGTPSRSLNNQLGIETSRALEDLQAEYDSILLLSDGALIHQGELEIIWKRFVAKVINNISALTTRPG